MKTYEITFHTVDTHYLCAAVQSTDEKAALVKFNRLYPEAIKIVQIVCVS